MKVSLHWLKEYVDIDASPEQLAEDLTLLGLEIEGIKRPGDEIQAVYIGQILAIEPHPDADKIVVCQTDVGGDAPLQICCGATNMKVGDKVPTAIVGATLPGGFAIGRRKMRGVESQGMMCSPRELGLGEDHDGLMILAPDTPVGGDAKTVLGLDDAVLEIEVTPNRGDWASMIGVARELAARYGKPLRLPQAVPQETGPAAAGLSSVTVTAPEICPAYLGRLIFDVKIGPSPDWLQKRLVAAGQRPINNVVDITNFVLLETGQPLHAFDYDKLAEHRIVVRKATSGEKIQSLDGELRTLHEDMLVIADVAVPQCIGGVMGGADSEVGEGTTRIFLESAYFDPRSVRKTARTLGLVTESSQRFQRGADPEMTRFALDRAAVLIQEIAGGTVAQGVLEARSGTLDVERTVRLRFERASKLLGAEVAPETQRGYLESLGFKLVEQDAEAATFAVPPRRHDVSLEADLIEELARFYGYDKLPAALPRVRPTQAEVAPEEKRLAGLRRFLAGKGLTEMANWTFSNVGEAENTRLDARDHRMVALQNPLSENYTTMRTSLIPGAVRVAAHNLNRGQKDLALFEIGPVFHPVEGQDLPSETQRLLIMLAGTPGGKHWSAPEREVDFYDLAGYVTALGQHFGMTWRFEACDREAFQRGQRATILSDKEIIGHCGRVNPKITRHADIDGSLFIAEIYLESLLRVQKIYAQFESIPTFPASLRDMAVLVDKAAPAGALAETAQRVGGKLLKQATVFDIYEGKSVPEGKKSVALGLRFQAEDRTLTDKDTQKAWDKILRTLEREHGAALR